MSEKSLFISAHPDDIEAMLGYEVLRTKHNAYAIVATDGSASSVNFTLDASFRC
jgi:hypothetical protein